MFPGLEDLNTYIETSKSPTLEKFASNKATDIAQWTLDLPFDTSKDIFDLWHRRFGKGINAIRPEMTIKKQPMTETWTTIARLKAKMKETDHTYVAAGLDVLNSYSSTVTSLAVQLGKRKVTPASSNNLTNEEDNTMDMQPRKRKMTPSSSDNLTNEEGNIMENALTIKDVVFGMALKKFRRIEWTESEKQILVELADGSPFLNINLTLSHAVISLLMKEDPLTGMELSVLNLIFQKKFDQRQVDHAATKISSYEMKNDTTAMYQAVLNLLESEHSSIEDALLEIDTFKAKFLKTEGRKTEEYIMLNF